MAMYRTEGFIHGLRDHWYKLFENQDLRITEGVMHRFVRQSIFLGTEEVLSQYG